MCQLAVCTANLTDKNPNRHILCSLKVMPFSKDGLNFAVHFFLTLLLNDMYSYLDSVHKLRGRLRSALGGF